MIVTSWDGFRWHIEEESDRVVLSKKELSVLRALHALPCDVFVDVGAHVGYHAVRMARRCRKVIAFEPDPASRARLLRNAELNGLDNITVYPHAAGESRYRARLWLAGASSTLLRGYARGESVEVEVVPLDDVVDRADIVKIDVEGYEWRAVQGMSRLIDSCRPALVIEHHDFSYYRIGDYPKIREFLRRRGYIEIFLTTQHRLWYPRGRPLEPVKGLVAHHWIQHCVNNLERGLPWYYGLPYTWWWGMHLIDFIYELPGHVLRPDEPEWVERLLRG
jgi:FkbM family methyltransferase